MSENKNTKIVLNRQSDGILDNAKITAPVGIEKTDLPGLVDDLAGLQETDKKLLDTVKEVDANLTEAISVETARAEAVEAAISNKLEAAIEAEHQHHIDGDANLQGQIDTILDGSSVDLDQFREVVAFVESIDLENDANLLGAVVDINSSVKATEEKLTADLAKEVVDREADVDAEEARAIAAEAALKQDLSKQIGDEVADRTADVDAEEARAKAAELKLTNDLAKEVTDRTADVDAEEVRAKAAEGVLTSDLAKEVADRTADVDAEEVRAKAAESKLTSDLSAEAARAIAAEGVLTSDLASEVARAEAAEAGLKSDINVEKGRIDAILDGSDVNLDQFKEVVAFVESIDMENDAALLTAVTDINSSISIEIADRTASDAALSADLSAEVANRIADVDAEEARAKAAEVKLTSDLSTEAARAKAAESAIDAAYKAADVAMDAAYKAADATLQSNINTEATERLAADVTLQGNLDAETSRAQSAEAGLSSDLAKEVSDRISDVNAEEARAKAAESKLTSDLSAEAARAISAEGVLTSDLAAEVLRAETAEGVLTSDLATEAARAKAAEAGLASDLSDEAARAIAAEAGLKSDIDTEKGRIDSILLASDADKDSFAEIVSLINSVDTTNDEAFAGYVLSNNAALSDEVARAEAAEAGLASDLADEKSRAMGVEADLASDLADEKSRAMAAEASLVSDLADEKSRAMAAEAGLTADLTSEVNRAIAAEEVLTSDLSAEVSRATAADAKLTSDLAAEVANREAGDSALQASLVNETSDRLSADQALQANLDAETARATAAEAALKKDLSENISNVETELTDAIDAEVVRATAAEVELKKDLTENIIKVETELTDAIDAEEARAIAAEAGLKKDLTENISKVEAEFSAAIEAEHQHHVDGDAKLQEQIDTILDGSSVDLDQFREVVAFVESIDMTNDDALLTAVTDINSSIDAEKVRAEEAEAGIITTVGYDEMGGVASKDYANYSYEVKRAGEISKVHPGKIQDLKDRKRLLDAAMSDNIFPVTIEGNEYVDADYLQETIDEVHAQADGMIYELNTSYAFLDEFGPDNIVNFESWVDYNQKVSTQESDADIVTAVGFKDMGEIASGDYQSYNSEVSSAYSIKTYYPAKIQEANDREAVLVAAMSDNIFPVTIEGNEYADVDSLQVAIDRIHAQAVEMIDELNSSAEFLSNFAPVNIVNFESWVDFNRNLDNADADSSIIRAVGYQNMGKVVSGDFQAYREEVGQAQKDVVNFPSKIDDINGLLTSLNDTMSIGEFPVTVEGNEYVDADSLQVAIDNVTADLDNATWAYDNALAISSNFAPVNIVNFESWVDAKVTAKNREKFSELSDVIKGEYRRAMEAEAQLASDLSDEIARATAAEEGLDSKIVDIISNTDITSIDSFSEVVADVDFAVAIVNYNAAMYVIDNRPTMTEFNESTDGLTTAFTADIILGTHIVFLNGLMQFEGRDYVVGGRLAARAVASADRPAAGKTPYHAAEQSLSIEFYTAPEATDVLNVYGVQTGTEMNAAMSLAEIAEAAGRNGDLHQPINPIRREDNVKHDVLAPATEAPATEAPATEAPATEAPATEAPATDSSAEAPADATEPTV